MTNDAIIYQLREKATHGDALTASEQTELIAWYVRQDPKEQEEVDLLASFPKAKSPWDALRDEMKIASERLQAASEQFQTQDEKYEDLRRDAAVLSEQIPKPKPPQKR